MSDLTFNKVACLQTATFLNTISDIFLRKLSYSLITFVQKRPLSGWFEKCYLP